jgi:hypothetical protein
VVVGDFITMFIVIVLALIAVLALGTIFIGPSVGYLGLALLITAVIVILVLATAHEETL